jgi:hypothetical protein
MSWSLAATWNSSHASSPCSLLEEDLRLQHLDLCIMQGDSFAVSFACNEAYPVGCLEGVGFGSL